MTHSSKMVLPSRAHPKHFTIAKSTIEVVFYACVQNTTTINSYLSIINNTQDKTSAIQVFQTKMPLYCLPHHFESSVCVSSMRMYQFLGL